MMHVDADQEASDLFARSLRLSDREFAFLSQLIDQNLGIQISKHKRSMLESRIARRMRELSLTTIGEYCERLSSATTAAAELQPFLNLVTTNKTSFFREAAQLRLVAERYLPAYLTQAVRERRPLRVWSAACSSGQEVWTLCMMLARVSELHGLPAQFVVIGSDVSTRVLKVAVAAKYPSAELEDVPSEYRHHLMRSKDPTRNVMRVAPALRQKAGFVQLNLMAKRYDVDGVADIVFLRNALIYFERERQHRIAAQVVQNLRPGGLFAVGLTETLHGAGSGLRPVGSSLYLREESR